MTSCKHALLLLALMAPFILTTHAALTITWTLQGTTPAGVSTSNYPGARYGATSWVDSSGKLWMFSGVGKENTTVEGYLNQLYQYNPTTNAWTLSYGTTVTNQAGTYPQAAGGTGTPGGRYGTARWADASGNLYLFGGQGIGSVAATEGLLNDFWRYSTSTNTWTWLGGQSTANAAGSANVTTYPSPRSGASYWIAGGNLYLFGGKGYTSGTTTTALLNDLWVYRPVNASWSLVTTDTKPTGRSFATCWTDADGNGWVYGGSDLNGIYYSDMWQYRLSANAWFNRAGSSATNQNPVFPTSSVTGNPGGLYAATSWYSKGQFYMFGGYGLTTQSTFSSNRDLWSFNGNTSAWTYVYGTSGTVTGSSSNPGGRYGAASWLDVAGNVIIFGGNGYDSNGASTSGILGDTRAIFACVFTSSCLLGANDTNTTTSTNNATTTGALTSSTGKATTTGGLTSTTGGPTTTTTATVNITLGMQGEPSKFNTSAVGASVAASLNVSADQVTTSIVLTKKRDIQVAFTVVISIFYPNSSAIAAATGGQGAGNITAQLDVLKKAAVAAANSTAVTNTLRAQNVTVTSIAASASSAVVVTTTTAKSSASTSTTYSAAITLTPTMGPLTQLVFALVVCAIALFLSTDGK